MNSANDITYHIIGLVYRIHRALGPGLLESAYQQCLYYLLQKEGIFVEREKAVPLVFEEVKLDVGYRIDLLVEHKIILEVKSVSALSDVHTAQVITYLKLSGGEVGLLLNFNVADMKKGINVICG
jgi:GxxExxY protein